MDDDQFGYKIGKKKKSGYKQKTIIQKNKLKHPSILFAALLELSTKKT